MDFHPALNPGIRTELIRLPDRLAEWMLADHDSPVEWAQHAILPYRFDAVAVSGGLQVEGSDCAVTLAARILGEVGRLLEQDNKAAAKRIKATIAAAIETSLKHELSFRLTGLTHPIRPMSVNQVAFMQALLTKDRNFVVGAGATGTGKTHLAIAAALNQLALEHVKHIVLTRPYVPMEGEALTAEARRDIEYGEQFDVFEDCLTDFVGYQEFHRLTELRSIEILPLGRMRGRTFNDSFIIVDEAQNMTVRKMRMAVTRIGQGSRMIVMGDPAHSDLRGDETSGLSHLLELVDGADFATVHHFETSEIVRNRIVARLEELYARDSERERVQDPDFVAAEAA